MKKNKDIFRDIYCKRCHTERNLELIGSIRSYSQGILEFECPECGKRYTVEFGKNRLSGIYSEDRRKYVY